MQWLGNYCSVSAAFVDFQFNIYIFIQQVALPVDETLNSGHGMNSPEERLFTKDTSVSFDNNVLNCWRIEGHMIEIHFASILPIVLLKQEPTLYPDG